MVRALELVLFFTRGVALQTWDHIGMFDREVALYRRLQECGVHVTFVTYGNSTDLRYADRIRGICILCNRWSLPQKWYERLLPWLHARYLRQANVLKTNQTKGSDVALRAAYHWKKPLVARCGYMWSESVGQQQGQMSAAAQHARSIEARIFSAASQIIVTTPMMAADITERIPESAKRIVIIPNYVEIDRFAPSDDVRWDYDVIFIGRISPEKNVGALLEAVESLPVKLCIIGTGELQAEFQEKYAKLGERVFWSGNMPNKSLPAYLTRSRVFILPSHYEGHPKTLLEAMSCGLPVIGADRPGIRELLRHGETGWLCGTDARSIREAIQHLLLHPDLCMRMGHNARQFVVENFSLERVVEIEMRVLTAVGGR